MNEDSRAASAAFQQGFNCAQSVAATFSERLGLDRETALRLTTGFGGGMAHLGQTCGAVTGAILLIGLRHGRIEAANTTPKQAANVLVQEFARRFCQRNHSLLCPDLLGVNLRRPAQFRKAREEGIFRDRCTKYVQDAAEIVGDLLFPTPPSTRTSRR